MSISPSLLIYACSIFILAVIIASLLLKMKRNAYPHTLQLTQDDETENLLQCILSFQFFIEFVKKLKLSNTTVMCKWLSILIELQEMKYAKEINVREIIEHIVNVDVSLQKNKKFNMLDLYYAMISVVEKEIELQDAFLNIEANGKNEEEKDLLNGNLNKLYNAAKYKAPFLKFIEFLQGKIMSFYRKAINFKAFSSPKIQPVLSIRKQFSRLFYVNERIHMKPLHCKHEVVENRPIFYNGNSEGPYFDDENDYKNSSASYFYCQICNKLREVNLYVENLVYPKYYAYLLNRKDFESTDPNKFIPKMYIEILSVDYKLVSYVSKNNPENKYSSCFLRENIWFCYENGHTEKLPEIFVSSDIKKKRNIALFFYERIYD